MLELGASVYQASPQLFFRIFPVHTLQSSENGGPVEHDCTTQQEDGVTSFQSLITDDVSVAPSEGALVHVEEVGCT